MRIPGIEIDAARRRVVARVVGVLTGTAVALTLVQFGVARTRDDGKAR